MNSKQRYFFKRLSNLGSRMLPWTHTSLYNLFVQDCELEREVRVVLERDVAQR